jgi:hypothetical protein
MRKKSSRPIYCLSAAVVAASLALGWSSAAQAQAGRLFLAVPVNSNIAIGTYNGTRSNTWIDESLSVPGTESRSQTGSILYSRIMDVFGRTGGPGISIPYSGILTVNQQTGQVVQDSTGFGDPSLTFDVNFFGAPAMTAEQFRNFVPVTYSGLHLTLGTPWGNYDPNSRTNIASNRWSFKALVNYSISNDGGQTWLDFYPSVRVFGDNNKYLVTQRLSQRPIFGLEAHYSATIVPRTWWSIGLIASAGGAISVDDAETVVSQETLRFALAAGFPAWLGSTGILAWNRTIARTDGAARSDNFMVQFIQKF